MVISIYPRTLTVELTKVYLAPNKWAFLIQYGSFSSKIIFILYENEIPYLFFIILAAEFTHWKS